MQRLYIMNLAFDVQENDLLELLQPFGEVESVEIPLRKGGTGTGYAFANFKDTEGAVSAFAQLDKTFF